MRAFANCDIGFLSSSFLGHSNILNDFLHGFVCTAAILRVVNDLGDFRPRLGSSGLLEALLRSDKIREIFVEVDSV